VGGGEAKSCAHAKATRPWLVRQATLDPCTLAFKRATLRKRDFVDTEYRIGIWILEPVMGCPERQSLQQQ